MSDETQPPLGQIVDSLGVEIMQREGDLISDVLIIAKLIDTNGEARLSVGWSEGMSWIERIGMLSVSLHSEQSDNGPKREDDE